LFLVACSSNNSDNTLDMSLAGDDLSTTPDQGAMACDITRQDCPTGQKCVVLGAVMATISCVMAGTVTDGMPCTRDMMGGDNCAAGLSCQRGFCRKYCGSDGDCDSGQQCASMRSTTVIGACNLSCTPFSNDCGTLNCSGLLPGFGTSNEFFTCRMPGTNGNFEDCTTGGAACGADAICNVTDGLCEPFCDDTHLCPALSADGGVAVSCHALMTTIAGHPGVCAQ
jgi:hypothetical protein